MARIRIVCRVPDAPARVDGQPAPYWFQILPSLSECRVYAVAEDGTETELTDVERVTWDSGDGRGPCRAVLHVLAPEIDVVGDPKPPAAPGKACCAFAAQGFRCTCAGRTP